MHRFWPLLFNSCNYSSKANANLRMKVSVYVCKHLQSLLKNSEWGMKKVFN